MHQWANAPMGQCTNGKMTNGFMTNGEMTLTLKSKPNKD
jgi:hypothetical protein